MNLLLFNIENNSNQLINNTNKAIIALAHRLILNRQPPDDTCDTIFPITSCEHSLNQSLISYSPL